MNITHVFIIFFALMVMQVVGTHLQVKQYRKAVRRVHKLGNVGIGSKRRRLGPGNVVLIACDRNGIITGGEIMEGMTIFTGFKKLEGIEGLSIYDLKAEYESLPKKRAKYYKGHIQALEALEIRLKSEEGAEEGDKASTDK